MKNYLLIAIFALFFVSSHAQKLPNLRIKPAQKFESPSFCPKEGTEGSDTEMNMAKNRIDAAKKYYPVDFEEVKNLHVLI